MCSVNLSIDAELSIVRLRLWIEHVPAGSGGLPTVTSIKMTVPDSVVGGETSTLTITLIATDSAGRPRCLLRLFGGAAESRSRT